MSAVTTADIRIETAIPLTDLQELQMDLMGNAHAVISLRGYLSEEEGEKALWKPVEDAPLRVFAGDGLLFAGIISRMEISQEGMGYRLSIQGISATAQLDHERKSRTFQNKDDAYHTVIEKVLTDTEGAGLRFRADDRKIGTPLYQLEETDWEFIKRLSSLLGKQVFPVVTADGLDICVGLPEGKVHSKEEMDIHGGKVWFDGERRSVCREFITYVNLSVGDSIRWEGYVCQIIEKHCRLEKGLLIFQYRAAERNGDYALAFTNPSAAGRLLAARVLETRNEQVKVKFDIDQGRGEDTYWYPWEPDAGNLLYCMPEKGEQIYICPGDHIRQQDRAVWGIHENGKGNPEMCTSDRYFTTADDKRMYLLPDRMGFLDLKQDSPLEVSLKDDAGAEIISNRNIVIFAKDTVGIRGKNLFFQAPKEVSLVRKDTISPAVINMCNGFDSIGASNEVTMDGNGDIGFPSFHEYQQEEGREYSLDGLEKTILASTPCRRLENEVWQQIRGAQVDEIKGTIQEGA